MKQKRGLKRLGLCDFREFLYDFFKYLGWGFFSLLVPWGQKALPFGEAFLFLGFKLFF